MYSSFKKTRTAGLVAIALILPACSTVSSLIPSGIPAAGGGYLSVTLKDEKALYAAEAAFAGVSYGLNAAVDAGILKGARAAQAKTYYDNAYSALKIARQAHIAGNATQLQAQVAAVLDLVGDLQAMLPKPTQ
jgi:hypothetical protein